MEIKERKELIRILPQPQWLCFRRADTTRWLTLLLRGFWEAERFWPCPGADLVCCQCGLGPCPATDIPWCPAAIPSQALHHEAADGIKQNPGRVEIWGKKCVLTGQCPSCWVLLWSHALGHGTSWKLEGCWLLLHRESPYSPCIVHPDYTEHRTTCVFLTICSPIHQAPCGSPVHPCGSPVYPPQPRC